MSNTNIKTMQTPEAREKARKSMMKTIALKKKYGVQYASLLPGRSKPKETPTEIPLAAVGGMPPEKRSYKKAVKPTLKTNDKLTVAQDLIALVNRILS